MLRDRCPVCPDCPACNVGVLWLNGWIDQWCHLIQRQASAQATLRSMGTQFPHGKGHIITPTFQPMCMVAKRLDGSEKFRIPLGSEVGLGPGNSVLHGEPAPPRKGVELSLTFHPMSIVATRSPISETAELLLTTAIWFHSRSRSIERKWSIFPIVYASAKLEEETAIGVYVCAAMLSLRHTDRWTVCNTGSSVSLSRLEIILRLLVW